MSQHSGRLSGFETRATLLPALRAGVFTVTNGPLYSNAQQLQAVVHHLVLDHILTGGGGNRSASDAGPEGPGGNDSLTDWLYRNGTLCGYPRPWADEANAYYANRSYVVVASARKRREIATADEQQQEGREETQAEEKEEHDAVTVLAKTFDMDRINTQYVGNYLHAVFGYFNVTYVYSNSSEFNADQVARSNDASATGPSLRNHGAGQLRFRTGALGRGYIAMANETRGLMSFDSGLVYFVRDARFRSNEFEMKFVDFRARSKRYHTVELTSFEPSAPPRYHRSSKCARLHASSDMIFTCMIIGLILLLTVSG